MSWSCGSFLGSDVWQRLPESWDAEGDGAGAPDGRHGLFDLVSVVAGQGVEFGGDSVDQPAHAGDFLGRWHRFGPRPVVDIGCSDEPFAVTEEVVQVGLEVGEVGDVGAEVVAADAPESVGASVAACFDVGRFGAHPERDDDFADRPADVFAVEQCFGLLPGAVAVPVELQRGHPVDGFASAFFADPVVPLCDVKLLVVHEFSEHVGRDPGVGVPLGVAVPVGIRHQHGLVEIRCRRRSAAAAASPPIDGAER